MNVLSNEYIKWLEEEAKTHVIISIPSVNNEKYIKVKELYNIIDKYVKDNYMIYDKDGYVLLINNNYYEIEKIYGPDQGYSFSKTTKVDFYINIENIQKNIVPYKIKNKTNKLKKINEIIDELNRMGIGLNDVSDSINYHIRALKRGNNGFNSSK